MAGRPRPRPRHARTPARTGVPPAADAPRRIAPTAGTAAAVGRESDLLEELLAQVGFTSSDLAAIHQPVLAIHGGRSHPRMQQQNERLLPGRPHAQAGGLRRARHLTPPHKAEPARLANMLHDFWTRSPSTATEHGAPGSRTGQ